ncbi:hypothetical protein MYCTH_94780 [Thermothelomyces thermophilus ATCC 42464]|uniref:Uncharacterized protein n=1 Tax=Thermothelomyces thermophilus (strain ATCC 42464 / BCRC 31852 / DSM 1799) TaxID=573729 RepID=G2QFE8_THET4|nr:uncharacterized protein MYCTH_94780 [Thermothelomyces thermophilus ATCC 42464]AEO59177.1 hypothetical protein MYCTH_94780 [Thermothelomyces thermophilus ATCC 42464]
MVVSIRVLVTSGPLWHSGLPDRIRHYDPEPPRPGQGGTEARKGEGLHVRLAPHASPRQKKKCGNSTRGSPAAGHGSVQSDGPADRAGCSTAPSWATEGCTVKVGACIGMRDGRNGTIGSRRILPTTCIPQNRFGVSTYLLGNFLTKAFHITSSARSDTGVLRGATWERGEEGAVNTTVLSPLSARFSKNRPLDRE